MMNKLKGEKNGNKTKNRTKQNKTRAAKQTANSRICYKQK